MKVFSEGTSIEVINNKIFVCNKNRGQWVELSIQGATYLNLYLKGNAPKSNEGGRLIEYLTNTAFLIEKEEKKEQLPIFADTVHVTVDVSNLYETQVSMVNKIRNIVDNIQLTLKYNCGSYFFDCVYRMAPDIVVISENDIDDFLREIGEIKSDLNIVISCENISLDDITDKISRIYSLGINSIGLFFNINLTNYTRIDSFIYLASEMMLGFNWNIAWCQAHYPVGIVYEVIKKVLSAYEDTKFDLYPTSPIYLLNIFQPCYKCNIPINKLAINKNGSLSPCEYINPFSDKSNSINDMFHEILKFSCVNKDVDISEYSCIGCEIYAFCPFKNPSRCCNNCSSIKFLQKFRLTVFSSNQTLKNNLELLDNWFKQYN